MGRLYPPVVFGKSHIDWSILVPGSRRRLLRERSVLRSAGYHLSTGYRRLAGYCRSVAERSEIRLLRPYLQHAAFRLLSEGQEAPRHT